MKRRFFIGVAAVGLVSAAMGGELEHRWVWLTDSLVRTDSVERVSDVVRKAKSCGMNGAMFGCGIEFYKHWPKVRRDRLERIRATFADCGMEMIPVMWALGYGSMQNYGVDYVEGVPVEGVPFIVQETNAVWDVSASTVTKLDAKTGFQRSGGYRRLIKKVDVKPHRRYRFAFEFRTKGLVGEKPFRVIARDACLQQYLEKETIDVTFSPTQDWTACSLSFNSMDSNSYYLYVGFMSGWKEGDFEVRNATLAETPPGNVLRRPGAPTVLRNAATGETYESGRDYVVPKVRYPVSRQDVPPVTLVLPPGSRIKPGDRLLFDCYAPAVVNGRQVSMCLSEPHLYESLEDSATHTEAALHPKRWMLSMDEFRNGGTCAACRARGLTMGQMYADAVTKAYNIIQKVHPGAEVYIWSDMLDPNHNAVKTYYNCRGSFEDGWKWVPKDLIICCWYDRKSDLSMPFFSSKGFRTLAAAYYDEKPPFKWSRQWRDVVRRTDGAIGIMYTTWRHAYDDLPAFGEMLNKQTEK